MGERRSRVRSPKGIRAFRARYTAEAAAGIRQLHPEINKDVREGIRRRLSDPFPGHPLHDELPGYHSLRIRSHRIIHGVNDEDKTPDIAFVGLRRNVYEQLRELLLSGSPRN